MKKFILRLSFILVVTLPHATFAGDESAGDEMIQKAREMTMDAANDIRPAPGSSDECFSKDVFDEKMSDICAQNQPAAQNIRNPQIRTQQTDDVDYTIIKRN